MNTNGQTSKQNLLRKVPLFSDLSKSNLDEIAKISDELKMSAGKVLARQGEPGLEFILILDGVVRVEKNGKLVNCLSANDFFGEISLIDGKPRSATVIAETNVKLLVVESRYFARLLEDAPRLSNEIMIALCQYVRGTENKRNLCSPKIAPFPVPS